ncbi:hypothetical protein [Streptomyces sp. NPDC089799]|uniref:hypothetical protein n=1 Tax=Streptomyces sp. NPDC089799 TaxID=3155066 RepID=UPI003431D998
MIWRKNAAPRTPARARAVVDGPGEAGLVIPALAALVIDTTDTADTADTVDGGTRPGHMGDWCADAERAGGAVVLSLDELPEVLDWAHLPGFGTARGGFMPGLG